MSTFSPGFRGVMLELNDPHILQRIRIRLENVAGNAMRCRSEITETVS